MGWTLCSRLATGRRRHCLAIVGRQLYVLAGIASSDDSAVLDSVEVSRILYVFLFTIYIRQTINIT